MNTCAGCKGNQGNLINVCGSGFNVCRLMSKELKVFELIELI